MTALQRPTPAPAAASDAALIAAVRDFVEREMLPVARLGDASARFPHEIVDGMRRLGLFGTIIPKEYGGLGLDMVTHVAIMEEVARGWVSMAGVLNPHVLCCDLVLRSGSPAQRAHYLPRMAAGQLRAAFSLSEPHAGSDAQAITTSARRAADGDWHLHGHKRWITNGLGAGVVFVLARSDPDAVPPHTGMTCFLVEKTPWEDVGEGQHAGVSVTENIDKMGDRGVETTDLVLDGYSCPGSRILGEEKAGLGRGFVQMMASLESGRISASALCVGVGVRCYEVAMKYATERRTFGKPIAEHQAIQFKLADMATQLQAARLLTRHAAQVKDLGQRADLEAGMAKLFASEASLKIAEDAFRIHGSNGYSKSWEIERLYRDALSLVSAEGPSEIQRMVIGRTLVREFGQQRVRT
ncbi:acyl-CoA dehydrogenase family protein [Variovorax sp. dw_954]|uniref:acyl-CoA dehydrogenase family protein n=1 Tax=Variovorax sp. dw_954 TaxID=2720078 RepID=UPI001BD6D9D2|nr:acyl-CoA dehydrogenase family protein [Variovorax sp. dw_954]